tara:strand:+ start:359 stop:754 length:396 start_codon:yes stop_codon:yes gene_type:complete
LSKTQIGDKMEAVVVTDMGNEGMTNENNFKSWFNNHDCKMDDEYIYVHTQSHEELIQYTFFEKAKTAIFKFETDGNYFPPILIHFIQHLEDRDGTQISVAEEGNYGEYNNLIDMTLGNFVDYVINGEDIDD